MRPGAGDVARRVSATSDDKEGQVESLGESDAGAVGADVQIETSQPVTAQTVGAALEDDSAGAVGFDTGADDFLVEGYVGLVVDAVVQRDVDGVVGAWVEGVTGACFVEGACAREEVFFVVFVE